MQYNTEKNEEVRKMLYNFIQLEIFDFDVRNDEMF